LLAGSCTAFLAAIIAQIDFLMLLMMAIQINKENYYLKNVKLIFKLTLNFLFRNTMKFIPTRPIITPAIGTLQVQHVNHVFAAVLTLFCQF
jgi:hypothetical protein